MQKDDDWLFFIYCRPKLVENRNFTCKFREILHTCGMYRASLSLRRWCRPADSQTTLKSESISFILTGCRRRLRGSNVVTTNIIYRKIKIPKMYKKWIEKRENIWKAKAQYKTITSSRQTNVCLSDDRWRIRVCTFPRSNICTLIILSFNMSKSRLSTARAESLDSHQTSAHQFSRLKSTSRIARLRIFIKFSQNNKNDSLNALRIDNKISYFPSFGLFKFVQK